MRPYGNMRSLNHMPMRESYNFFSLDYIVRKMSHMHQRQGCPLPNYHGAKLLSRLTALLRLLSTVLVRFLSNIRRSMKAFGVSASEPMATFNRLCGSACGHRKPGIAAPVFHKQIDKLHLIGV